MGKTQQLQTDMQKVHKISVSLCNFGLSRTRDQGVSFMSIGEKKKEPVHLGSECRA